MANERNAPELGQDMPRQWAAARVNVLVSAQRVDPVNDKSCAQNK